MSRNLLVLHNTLKTIRQVLYDHDYIEVSTPLIRKGTNPVFQRMKIDPGNGTIGYLRDSMEIPLRSMLKYADKVFEIGKCARMNDHSKRHRHEFLMLELYSANQGILEIFDLTIKILEACSGKKITYKVTPISQFIKKILDIDINESSDELLKEKILAYNGVESYINEPTYEIVNHFIDKYLINKSGYHFLTEFPLCTMSGAKRINNSNIIERFELFADGIEVVHAYTDETNIEDYIERSKAVKLYNYEEEKLVELLKIKELPTYSVGLGIGIERLCMAITGSKDIKDFMFAQKFSA